MPRFYDLVADGDAPGHLIVESQSKDYVEIFYTLSQERLDLWKYLYENELQPDVILPERVKLLQVDVPNHLLTMHPIKTRVSSRDLLRAKYNQVERITIANESLVRLETTPSTRDEVMMLLEDLPSCFVKDYDYGLGLTSTYRCIIDAVERLTNCTEILISEHDLVVAAEQGTTFHISTRDFDEVRKSINRTMSISQVAARSVKNGTTYNFFASKLGRPNISIPSGRNPLRRRITNLALGDKAPLSEDEQDALLTLVAQNTETIARTKSDRLASLKRDIELVTLDNLIESYESMVVKKLPEGRWQVFLNENPFILTLAFGYPVIKVHDQASVGGRTIFGTGEKIADFLVKHSMTNNVAIVEIKKPQTKLLNQRKVSDGVYAPSGELVGAMNQTLDQKHRLEQEIAQIKVNSRIYDIESYSLHCCLIVGTVPSGEDRLRSFEMFRGNSKDVEIITFDELLEKLKHVREFLNSPEPEMGDSVQSSEPPF